MAEKPPSHPKDERGIEEPSYATDQMISKVPPRRFWVLSLGYVFPLTQRYAAAYASTNGTPSRVCLGLFLSILDTSIVATSLYTIGVDFEAAQSVNWVALAYTLSYLSCAVTFTRVSDVIGRRNAFMLAYSIFIALSLGCGFARNIQQLIAMRVVQGVGGSGLYSLSMVILTEASPPNLRQFIGGLIGMVLAGSGVLGPVLGGLLTQYASWRWVFWINAPIGVVSMAIFFFSWPKPGQLPLPPRRLWKNFDYLGAFLVIAAAVLVVFAFQKAGESSENGWRKPVFIAPLLAGLICWGLLIMWETWANRRFGDNISLAFPIGLFRNRYYNAAVLCTLFLGYPFLLIVFSFPNRAQIVSEKSAAIAGVMLLPMLAASSVATMVTGKVNSTKNRFFESVLAGACCMTLGCGLLITVSGSSDDAKALGFIVFTGFGFGISTSACTIAGSLESPPQDRAPAQGILAQLRILGGSLGIATSTAFLQSQINDQLQDRLSPQQLATLGGGEVRLTEEELAAIQGVYSTAFQNGMIASTAVSGVAIILAFIAFPKGRRKHMSDIEVSS